MSDLESFENVNCCKFKVVMKGSENDGYYLQPCSFHAQAQDYRELVSKQDAELVALRHRIAALEAALGKYGRHDDECDDWAHNKCSCGLEDAVRGKDSQ